MTSHMRSGTVRRMRNLAIAVLAAVVLSACSVLKPSPSTDYAKVGAAVGSVACLAVANESPNVKTPLADALASVSVVLDSPSPSGAAVAQALSRISDPKVQAYAAGVLNVLLLVYPNLPANADEKLPSQAVEALKAGVAACNLSLGVTTTSTSTSTTSTTL